MAINPQLLFVAGPNGAGKSTFSEKLSNPGAVIFDVDKVIARLEAQSPAMPKKQLYQEATNEFIKQVNGAVKQKRHFTLETTSGMRICWMSLLISGDPATPRILFT